MKRLILAFAFVLPLCVAPPAYSQTAAEDLVTARAKYGPLVTRAQLGSILNEVAWKHKSEGFGLLGKSAGNNCPQPRTSKPVSCDWLVNLKTHRGGDVINSATNDDGSPAPGRPAFNQDASYDGSNFTEPVEPESVGAPPPPPPVDPPIIDLRPLLDKLAALEIKDTERASELFSLRAKVEALEAKPGPEVPTGCKASVLGINVSCRLTK